MPLLYTLKHVFRSWKLFLALLIGIALASAFFAGTDVKANVTAKQALEQQLSNIYVDMEFNPYQLNSTRLTELREAILDVEGVNDSEIICRSWAPINFSDENYPIEPFIQVVGIADYSHVYQGWLNKPAEGLSENETYIPENSALASKMKIGDVIQLNFSIYDPEIGNATVVPLNLTVKGFAQLDDKACSIVSGYSQWISPVSAVTYPLPLTPYPYDFLLVSWEKTLRKIWDEVPSGQFPQPSILIYLNRDAIISPWDIQTSINNVGRIRNNIENKIATDFDLHLSVQDNLQWPLQSFQINFINIRFALIVVSLPIFFVAWYMGTTVSDVSFNLRRREIGLLSTKGFSRGQVLRMFLTETLLIGLIGGLLGVLLGFLLNPLFTGFDAATLLNLQTISPYTMVFTVAFGTIMAFLSTFSSARKAAQLPTVDALREYLPMETEKPHRKRLPWIAFILGTYKITVFILGINATVELSRIMFSAGNFILILLIGIFIFIDSILNYIGPLLFFWGSAKLFIQGSLKFQELTAKAARFMGDLGVLATKNVRRNPARSAAIAFLIALIIGYGVQVTGQLASEQDYTTRRIYYAVGADVSANVANASEAPNTLNAIMANVSEHVKNATTEYSIYLSTNGMQLKAVEPHSWLETAYYENAWFSGADVETAFNALASNNKSIILERRIAQSLNLKIGDNISVSFDTVAKTLQVVGFFGPEPSDQTIILQSWSFIPEGLYKEVSNNTSPSAKILLKLDGGVDGKSIAESIRDLDLNVSNVMSFAEELEKAQANVLVIGSLDMQRLGVVFAVLAASVGTAVVSLVSMRERGREATIMSVKGLSYKQLVVMFLTENLAVVAFSIILGVFVGFVAAYGNVSLSNAMYIDVIKRRLVFSPDTALMIVSCITLIFASTILPIIIMSRKYVTKLERMVRLR